MDPRWRSRSRLLRRPSSEQIEHMKSVLARFVCTLFDLDSGGRVVITGCPSEFGDGHNVDSLSWS